MPPHSDLTVVILTLNEENHIARCLSRALKLTHKIFVVDSFSTDATTKIAASLGADVYQHEFINHATQYTWALENLPINSTWVMKLDADEVISDELAASIPEALSTAPETTNGFEVLRYVTFMGGLIRHGNFPQWTLRIWRHNHANIEQRWMDEHIVLKSGTCARLKQSIIDDNLNNVTWWVTKHNSYASREAIDLLNIKNSFAPVSQESGSLPAQARAKRMLKVHMYSRIPLGFRAFTYFIYRYFFQLGFLDGYQGFTFHFLQGFWYRFLVDVKVWEVEHRMRVDGIDCVEAIRRELGIELNRANAPGPASPR